MKFHLIAAALTEIGFAVYGTPDVMGFLDGLDSDAEDKVDPLIEQVAQSGPSWNREKSKKLVDEIYQLKAYQVRLAYVYGPRRRTILLIHGIRKKSDEWPRNELRVAKRIAAETETAANEGTVEYVE